ncbi:hypothetical protein A2482_00320 [Candidatus Falkowbacteria bacterium RIFOXYC2_FULL_48_21]|uniref:Uncharacterized protein n=1 Tax=Candidatus Falkowbacteria bacterium RIFOXYC2_FULL_48_21 TaxID=1798005 RepID=A0A1F5TDU3_9BACT|nr:MAG: hypothetical protein A2482_00320 [Candidatus Falkowbacteria bacterium RIFOXYC2_FULL_48_21]
MGFTRQQVIDVLGTDVVTAAERICIALGKYFWHDLRLDEQKRYLAEAMQARGFGMDDIDAAFRNAMSDGH